MAERANRLQSRGKRAGMRSDGPWDTAAQGIDYECPSSASASNKAWKSRRAFFPQIGSLMTKLTINGEQKSFEAPADMPLLWVLRDVLGMTGTKFGCGIAQCGACTVHIDGKPVRSCMLPVGAVRDRVVTTIEGVGATPVGAKVQKAWLDLEVIQCGYCQSGQIMSAAALLASTPNPDDSDIDAAMAGNICRCGTYVRIRAAIKQAASQRQS
jgi:isoquinoline 1-oxidoreductase alpha subunit